MSEQVYAGLTSQSIDIFLGDSSSTTGEGLTGLAYNTSGLTCYYRKGATGTPTAIALATQTVGGAWSSGGFVQVDGTNMPGVYRFDLPNAVVDTLGFVTVYFKGAADLVPTALRIDCRAVRAVDSSGNAIAPASATTAILAIFTGITSLAQWLGLIAGKQTGNSTARTELRATGAGSGTYDETTDSQEAIRDRGDVAWISGAGASAADIAAELASQPIVIQSPTTTNGTLDLVQGMDYYTADGRDIEFTFIREYTPSSCKLTIAAGAVVTVTSTDIAESSGSGSGRFHVRFELPRTTGDDLEAGPGSFEVLSIVGGNEVPEIAEGVATIRRRLTA